MPIPVAAAAAAAGAISNQIGNVQNLIHSEFDYRRKRRHALEDWHRQNAYNSPSAQMRRLQEAGLNPALMYGKSASPGVASNVSQTDSKPPNLRPVLGENAGVLTSYFDTKIKQAQVDNLEADNTIKKQDALLRAAQVNSTTADYKTKKFDLAFKNDLRGYSADLIRESVRQKTAQIDQTITQTARTKALMSSDIESAAIKILRDKVGYKIDHKRLKLAVEDIKLKQLEAKLAKDGIYKSDPLWLRVIMQNIDDVAKKFKNFNLFPN